MDTDLVPFEPKPETPTKGKPGRPKGSKNRTHHLLVTAQRAIEEKFGIKNFDPVVFLLTTAADITVDMELRLVAATKAAPYIHATAKPVVIDTGDKKEKPVDMERLMQKVARELLIENHVTTKPDPAPDDEVDEEQDEEQEK